MSFIAFLLLASFSLQPTFLEREDPPPLSLEQLLERSRAQRDSLLASFREETQAVLEQLDKSLERGRRTGLDKLRARLVRLGPEATPLFVLELDPGPKPDAAQLQRSEEIGLVLAQLSTRNVSPQLIGIFEKGSRAGQRNALRVLGHSDDPERVGRVLRARFAEVDAELRALLIVAIATLGGEPNFNFVGDVLSNKDPKIVKSALKALADNRCSAASPKILELLRTPNEAAAQVPEIVAYYRACPKTLDSEHCTELVAFTLALKSNAKMAERILYLLSEHEDDWGPKIKKQIKELTKSTSNRIAEAAQVCLARTGDRGIKKKLLAPYDAVVKNNGRLASSWQRRAEMNMLIGENKNAIRDFLEAQKLTEGYRRSDPEIYIGIARAYARLRKWKDAVKWLDQGGLNISQLHLLSRDPDFAPLLEDEDLNKVFRLDVD